MLLDGPLGEEQGLGDVLVGGAVRQQPGDNVVPHGGSPDVTGLISVENASVTLEVRDTGRWRPRRTRRRVAEDADAVYGRGLDLVRLCSSWTRAGITPAGTRMVACLSLAAPVR